MPAEANAELDRTFWSQASPAQRLEAVWQMAKQWWQNENPHGPPPRLDLLLAFAEERVDYLLVGGQAVALHGVPLER